MRRILAAVLVLGSLITPATSRAVPVPGASPNVDLVTQIPDVQLMGGRIVGHYLYATGTAGLRIYDISNPAQPVPAGALAFPVFSNEDVEVSASRKLVLLSSDHGGDGFGELTVVDVANPMLPTIKGVLEYTTLTDGHKEQLDGVGHIANCIADCARYAWITGARDGWMLVVDLKDPASPSVAGWFYPTPGHPNVVPPTAGVFVRVGVAGHTIGNGEGPIQIVHDVNVDPGGDVWMTGAGGIARMDARNPLNPKEFATSAAADNHRLDQLVMHNSERLDKSTLLVTEEDWIAPQCDGGNEGSFQTWSIPKNGRGTLKPLAQWTTELGTFIDGGTPVAVSCSSHWFDLNRKTKVVADAWYQQGIRFLDVSNPRKIRQVGYYIPPWEVGGLGISQTLWATNDIVYGMSLTSGLVVLRIKDGGAKSKTVRAPILPQWLGTAPVRFAPHPIFGYACAIERSA